MKHPTSSQGLEYKGDLKQVLYVFNGSVCYRKNGKLNCHLLEIITVVMPKLFFLIKDYENQLMAYFNLLNQPLSK